MNKNKSRIFFTIIIMILLVNISIVSISVGSSSMSSEKLYMNLTQSDLDIYDLKIRLLMIAGYTPSLSACIIKEDEVVWDEGYGFYDFDGFKKPSTNTIYQVASVSKTITATAILQLYEKGLFDLDDDVSQYLDFDLRNPNFPDVPITFRLLLSHHSSLHDHSETAAYEYFAGDYPLSYIEELLVPGGEAYHAAFWGNYPPGGGGNYSNLGFNVLGYLVERLSEQSLEEYCRQNIFDPLEMDNTSFQLDQLPLDNLAGSYRRIGRFYIKIEDVDYTFLDPCGGLMSTIEDLSHFCIAHMNQGVYDEVRILNQSTIKEMHRLQFPDSPPYYGILRFGLGWLLYEEEFGVNAHGHDGDITFSHARMRIFDENNTAVIYLFNKGLGLLPTGIISTVLQTGSDLLITKALYDKANNLDAFFSDRFID